MSPRGLYLLDDKSVLDIRISSFYFQQWEVLSGILCQRYWCLCLFFKRVFHFSQCLVQILKCAFGYYLKHRYTPTNIHTPLSITLLANDINYFHIICWVFINEGIIKIYYFHCRSVKLISLYLGGEKRVKDTTKLLAL